MTNKQKGFTIIELLVVATIMILLTTIGLVSYQTAARNARNGKRKADLETVRSALVLYRSDLGTYPVRSGQTAANYSLMLGTVSSYISSTTIADPKNTAPYQYTYSSTGVAFTLCGTLEPDPGTSYCVNNP